MTLMNCTVGTVGDDSKYKTILSLLVKCEPAVFVRLSLSPLLIVVLLQVRGQCAFLTLINIIRKILLNKIYTNVEDCGKMGIRYTPSPNP
jgi:hypothetical protein